MQLSLSPDSLPIASHLPAILGLLRSSPALVVSGKTGCGKSTQVPKAIWKDDPSARIAVCQPRRVAATSLAVRVSQEVGCKLGSKVGYHIGMQSFKNQNCAIVYMTYGILIQQLLFQKELPYTHIVLDQIHERSLEMDFTFVALKILFNKRIREGHKVAKLIVMSATLNSTQFSEYFSIHSQTQMFFIPEVKSVPLVQESKNRRGKKPAESYLLSDKSEHFKPASCFDIPEDTKFRIEEIFRKGNEFYDSVDEEPRLSQGSVQEAIKILYNLEEKMKVQGDVLIFLPGYFQIQMVKKKLIMSKFAEERIVEVHSIFSEELYQKLFESKIKNKLILATNIGQSSITLPFCKAVIDFCLTKRSVTKSRGMNQLEMRFASRASMTQRAGRVGRVANGYVFRMITQEFYNQLPQYEEPEIKGISLEMVILRAKQLDLINQSDVFSNPYQFLMAVMDPPAIDPIKDSIQHLLEEEALIGSGPLIDQASNLELTKIGQFMVSMPCDLQVSKMIMMGIKLKIPSLILEVAGVMMATKMFFTHEERRENIEEFMHALIGYDQGLSNDFLMRAKLYSHWKERFYYPAKEKKYYSKWAKKSGQKYQPKKNIERQYESLQDEELYCFIQQFTQEKWSQHQKDFCFPRGVSLNTMREIVKIEENLKIRLKNMNIMFPEKEIKSPPLFLLCLAYAFPSYDCEVIKGKYIKSEREAINYVEIPEYEHVGMGEMEDYLRPERAEDIVKKGRGILKVIGKPTVLKKFLFPQYFNKSTLNNNDISELFYRLAKDKITNRFECEVVHQFSRVVILNESINRVLIPPDTQKSYKLLTNQMNLTPNKKLVKMCALIDEEMFLMTQLVTSRDAEVSMHPSREMLSQFKVGGYLHKFKRVITEKELEVINKLRAVAIRKKNNSIESTEEVIPDTQLQILVNFLSNKGREFYEQEPWEKIFVKGSFEKGDVEMDFHPISHSLEFKPEGTFNKAYVEWKKQEYFRFINNYRKLLIDQITIICSQCPHIEPIERLAMLNLETSILQLNQYSGSWEINKQKLMCSEGHQVGEVITVDQEARIFRENVQVYIPIGHVEPLWEKQPHPRELQEMNHECKSKVKRSREGLSEFTCPFCLDKDDETALVTLYKKHENDNFWKKMQGHLGGYQHIEEITKFKKSLRKQK